MSATDTGDAAAPNDLTLAIAQRVKRERAARNWSLTDLAERSGVSKAMISKIERGEASPTATVLGRLSGALGLALSVLLALAEQSGKRVSRRAEQVVWRDPGTGYTRRTISPPGGGVLEHLEIELPARVRVPYPASAFSFHHEQIIVMQGTLVFIEGALEHRLEAGDCLQLGSPEDCTFLNPGETPCRYLIALVRR
ncbi:transcriptional regulator with XRE-family HTH domain [Janthinobacterium sp. CG_23.3]|uniref:helix-turn-helix domain-containing protein n=1 Tax=unclassified Janthinobacterium TaxID=2610881 RepID=UPI0003476166|nr:MULTISPECIES: XRE family transcriptional regulator [unclassified Janthinobacterium]MEC5159538.1 transcriptional regulator with XRE-family HTH domain [Janthinobacterium sp. CG_S6]